MAEKTVEEIDKVEIQETENLRRAPNQLKGYLRNRMGTSEPKKFQEETVKTARQENTDEKLCFAAEETIENDQVATQKIEISQGKPNQRKWYVRN